MEVSCYTKFHAKHMVWMAAKFHVIQPGGQVLVHAFSFEGTHPIYHGSLITMQHLYTQLTAGPKLGA